MSVSPSVHSCSSTPRFFWPAAFVGLRVGKATISELQQRLGLPARVFRDQHGNDWLYYNDGGDISGRIEIIANSKTGVITAVTLDPLNLTVVQAKAHFGSTFRLVRYKHDHCLTDGDGAPMYEREDGPIVRLVAPERGVALTFEGDQVATIEYLAQPLGANQSRCASSKGNSTKTGRKLR